MKKATKKPPVSDTDTDRDSEKFIVRMPAGMREYLANLAKQQGRSMNREVVLALAMYIAADGNKWTTDSVTQELSDLKNEIAKLRQDFGALATSIVEGKKK